MHWLNYVFGAQKNRLNETVLLSTHNICFVWEISKLVLNNTFIERPSMFNEQVDKNIGYKTVSIW